MDNVDNPPGSRRSPRAAALRTLALLEAAYPEARCALRYASPWQLLVATILSAQCTDLRVNQVTPALFARFPAPSSLAVASPDEVEELIRSTGFFRNKARHLIGCARALVSRHSGAVPESLDELVALPGVGRKTANVVLGNAFGIPGLVVDTHVGRVAGRLGWTVRRDPVGIEADLCRLLPREKWTGTSHVLIWHGRGVCKAPVPRCSECPVGKRCPRRGVLRAR